MLSPLPSFFHEYVVPFWVTVVTRNSAVHTTTVNIELGAMADSALFVITHVNSISSFPIVLFVDEDITDSCDLVASTAHTEGIEAVSVDRDGQDLCNCGSCIDACHIPCSAYTMTHESQE